MDAPSRSTSVSSSSTSSSSTSSKSATTQSQSEGKCSSTSLTAGSSTSSSKKAGSRVVMTWNDDKDLALLVEVASINPFSYKKGSKERGKCWTEVADLLVKQGFKVDQRAVRDRYNYLQTKNNKKNNQEKNASGIAPEMNPTQAEISNILEDLAQQDEDSETMVAVKSDEEQKKVDGVEMRKRLVETFAETNKRLKNENEPKKKRNSGSDVASFMAMKLQLDREIRAQELQDKKDEAARREAREEREQERRRQLEAENARKEAEKERKEAEKERKFELVQQQLLQQSNQISSMLMMLMQQQQNNK